MSQLTDQASGFPVPDALRPLWNDIPAVRELLLACAGIRIALKLAMDTHDPLYSEINLPDAIAQAKLLESHLLRAIPYAVCPACQGAMMKACKLCKGRGAISKFLWDSPAVREAIKQMRKKVIQ